MAQEATIFPKGEVSTNENHTGTIWLNELNQPDSIFNFSMAQATYAPGAKLDWHIHPAGQSCLLQKAQAITRKKENQDKSFTKEMLLNVCPEYHIGTVHHPEHFAYIAVTPTTKGQNDMVTKGNR